MRKRIISQLSMGLKQGYRVFIVKVIRKIILEAGVYEEEDHQPTIYGFKMPGTFSKHYKNKDKSCPS